MNSFLYTLSYAILFSAAHTVGLLHPKVRAGVLGRRKVFSRAKRFHNQYPGSTPFWFHIASSGELEQCLPLLDEIKKREPEQKIVLTFFSPTAKRALELESRRRKVLNLQCPWDWADYAPYDFAWSTATFLDLIKPRAFIAIYREIWPNLLKQANLRKVPCYLFAAYFPKESGKFFFLIKPWLSLFTLVGTADLESLESLKAQAPELNISVLGDPRIERVIQRKERQQKPVWREFFPSDPPVFVLASIWPEDWLIIERVLPKLIDLCPALRIVIAPHEPEAKFITEINRKFSAKRWTRFIFEPDSKSSLILDKVGELAEIYQVASLVFVGGSFRKKVHNVLEPAVYGCPLLTGPLIKNSIEALKLSEQGALKIVLNSEELIVEARLLIEDSEERLRRSKIALTFIQSNRGAEIRYVDCLMSKD